MMLNLNFTQEQGNFHLLNCRYPLFVGGYGSGKTQAMIDSAFMDATHAGDALIALYEPTYDLIDLTVAPRLLEKLDTAKIIHRYNRSKHTISTHSKKNVFGNFIMRSLDNPATIVSYQAYRSHVDELDTIPYKKANELWLKIIGRNRQIPDGYDKHNVRNRVSVYTTPEGFNFVHRLWVQKKGIKDPDEYQYVRASSLSNPFLPTDYIESLKNNYSDELQKAYIEGEFVNLTSGTVYRSYNRVAHNSVETIKDKEPLFIGNDFNVTRQAATVYVKRQGGKEWHAVEELVDMYDTEDMVRIINERWRDKGHHITVYPDASGNSRHTNARVSDIAILRQARYDVRVKPTNPLVRDRINAVNRAFEKGNLFVNWAKCPTVADCLEQQSYDKNGEPDKKSGNDHQNDATGYPIAYELPIHKPVAEIGIRFN